MLLVPCLSGGGECTAYCVTVEGHLVKRRFSQRRVDHCNDPPYPDRNDEEPFATASEYVYRGGCYGFGSAVASVAGRFASSW